MSAGKESVDSVLQLARLALSGKREDLVLYVKRLSRNFRLSNPLLAESLSELLEDAQANHESFKRENESFLPYDSDSKLSLIRMEFPVKLETDPIWSDSVRSAITQIVDERKQGSLLRDSRVPPTRTALFVGPPGVGKTMSAKWLARELNVKLLTLDLSAVMSSFLGKTGVNLRQVLDYSKSERCILLLDELDSIAKKRDDSLEVGELKRLVTVLLQEIDEWPENNLLIAATNHADLLDPAVWRRFEFIVEFDMPESDQVEVAVRKYFGERFQELGDWLSIYATTFQHSSFSDIERDVKKVIRASIIQSTSLIDIVEQRFEASMKTISHEKKREIALRLSEMGYPTRRVQELTGISRATTLKDRNAAPKKKGVSR